MYHCLHYFGWLLIATACTIVQAVMTEQVFLVFQPFLPVQSLLHKNAASCFVAVDEIVLSCCFGCEVVKRCLFLHDNIIRYPVRMLATPTLKWPFCDLPRHLLCNFYL